MKRWRNALIVWILIVTGFSFTLLLPHKDTTLASFINYSLQAFLFVLSCYLIRHEPTKKNKYIFVNFAGFFAVSFVSHLYNFVGTILFVDHPFARLFINQYLLVGLYVLLLTLAIVYLAIDVLFRDFTSSLKYVVASAIAVGFFAYYFNPYLADPKHSYHTDDVLDWKTMYVADSAYAATHGIDPTPEQLAASVEMHSWRNGEPTGILYPEAKLARIRELFPYLSGSNFLILIYRPIYLAAIRMFVVCLGFVLLFFGYLYMKDPPQGAYIEKVMFLFLVFCTLEIVHAWSFVKSVEWQAVSGIWGIGQYMSIGVLLLIAVTLSVRLHFITSVKGEFYEQELAVSPSAVTRWRDTLDNIVIEKFFNRKLILGRLFINPSQADRN